MAAKPPNVLPIGTDPTADNFVVESSAPNVGFLKRAVQPPSDVYIESTDVLVVGVATSQTSEVLTVNYRLLRFDGILIHGQFTISPPNNRTVTIHSEPLAEGFLMSMSCRAAVATTRGQTFVRAFLTKLSLGIGQPSYMLMADYVTTAMAPAFPNGRISAPSEGPGFRYSVTGVAPAPGFEWRITVPPNARWRVDTGITPFVTSAAAGNRAPGLTMSVGGITAFVAWGEENVAATTSVFVSYSKVRNVPITPLVQCWAPLPIDLIMLGGDLFTSFTAGLQALDQYGPPTVAIEEWLDNV